MVECAESAESLEVLFKKKEKDTKQSNPYFLPDGTMLSLGNERYLAPEIMFNPSKIGLEYPGIHELAFSSLKKTSIDLRKYLYSEILLSGGNTEIEKFPKRLVDDLSRISAKDVKVLELC